MSIEEKLKEQIAQNNILIYMKGTPYEPRCGFSAKTVQALIDTCNKYNKVPIRYYKLKSKILKIKNFADYDRYAPLGQSNRKFSFADAKKLYWILLMNFHLRWVWWQNYSLITTG